MQFYRRFLESPNFSTWFERRRGRAAAWQQAAWERAESDRGVELDLAGSSEVELVETFAALERRFEAAAVNAEDAVDSPRVRILPPNYSNPGDGTITDGKIECDVQHFFHSLVIPADGV